MRNFWIKKFGYNPFKGSTVVNFRRSEYVRGENNLYLLKIDKNNCIYEVLCGAYSVAKSKRPYFVGEPERHQKLFQKIRGRVFYDLIPEIVLRYDLTPSDEE